MAKRVIKESKPIYGAVCKNWEGRRVYTSFSSDPQELIRKADSMFGIIAVEKAHAGEPPLWERDNDSNSD